MTPIIKLKNIHKSFADFNGKHLQVLEDIDLQIFEGEFFVFLGPSGSGKSTLMRIMSGLEKSFQGQMDYAAGLKNSDFSFVFQDFALLPWLTVSQNIALGLIAKNIPENKQSEIVERELKQFGLEKFGDHYPKELSGGMKQRVGFARALAVDPKIIFMDEAFSALDSFIAKELREELLNIWMERKTTIVMVTHNIEEALQLGDRIAVLTNRPAKIKKILTNPLPRPRAMRSKDFFELVDELYNSIKI